VAEHRANIRPLASIEAVESGLPSQGDIASADRDPRSYLAQQIEKPILVEGPDGRRARPSLQESPSQAARAMKMIRLQCTEGLERRRQAPTSGNKAKQQLLHPDPEGQGSVKGLGRRAETACCAFDQLHDDFATCFSKEIRRARGRCAGAGAAAGGVLMIDEDRKSDAESSNRCC